MVVLQNEFNTIDHIKVYLNNSLKVCISRHVSHINIHHVLSGFSVICVCMAVYDYEGWQ